MMYDEKLEYTIIGTLLTSANLQSIIGTYSAVEPETFVFLDNRRIYKYLQQVESGAVSIAKLCKAMPDAKEYILKVVNMAAPFSIRDNMLTLIDLHKRRRLIDLANDIKEAAENFDTTANESLVEINTAFENNFKKGFEIDIKTSGEVSKDIYADLCKEHDITSTGLSTLDIAMGGGFYKGKAYAIAARKKVGKTVMASTISNNLNFAGKKHLFIAAEMSPNEIHQRNIGRNINRNSLCFIGREKHDVTFTGAVKRYQDPNNIYYMKAPGIPFNRLRMAISAAILKFQIEGVILDYFQLVGGAGKAGLTAHYDEVAQWLANFCRDNNIWCLVMAQMNQESNIRGGEGLKLAFDQVYELKKCEDSHAEGYYMEMTDTRYTSWLELGDNDNPMLSMEKAGPYFKLINEDSPPEHWQED